MKVIYLEISTFRGWSIGAIHFYGKLIQSKPYKNIDLMRVLTKKDAKFLTKLHGEDYQYVAGMEVFGFDTREDLIRLAIKTYKNHFPDAKILICGRPSLAEPQRILDGKTIDKQIVERWIKRCEELHWFDGTKEQIKETDSICNKWNRFLQTVENEY